ncbi:hypothetical protein Cgig2_033680 [Carnegiea gigantea]|uniref:Uncharacterized protein n=1 Tax=Carnegiea gigantea TaxID=171969 RepID=A0A9Q1JTA6_9CARY|nr:hypothetical protein Cgig2_033680 [Carnegiea gigantea]
MTVKCRKLRKALHKLVDKGQIGRFLKRGPRFLQKEREPKPRDEECSTEIVATIAGGYIEGITRVKENPHFTYPHNDPLVVEMKVASAIIRRILIDTRSSADIITWDCLKKLKSPGKEIIPLVHRILGFGRQEVNPTGMTRLPLHFGDNATARNLELQFEADNGNVDKMQGDQRTARECYLISIRPLVERTTECGPIGPPPSDKKSRATPHSHAGEALEIHTLASIEPERPLSKAVNSIEQMP